MLRWRYSHATRSNHGWVSFLWRISVFPIFFWQTYAKKSKSNESKLDNYFAIHSLKIVGKPRLIMFILIKNGWHSAVWSTWCSETIKEKRKSKVSSVCSRHVALPRLTFLGFFFAIKMWWFNRLSSLKEFILSSLCTVDCCLSLTDDRNTSYTMQYSCHMPNMQLVFFFLPKTIDVFCWPEQLYIDGIRETRFRASSILFSPNPDSFRPENNLKTTWEEIEIQRKVFLLVNNGMGSLHIKLHGTLLVINIDF